MAEITPAVNGMPWRCFMSLPPLRIELSRGLRCVLFGALLFVGLAHRLTAQEIEIDPSRRYRMLRLSDSATVIERTNDVASDGYRVRGLVPHAGAAAQSNRNNHLKRTAGAVVLLEKVGSPLENFQYKQIVGGGSNELEPRLNKAGGAGFRLMSRDVALAWAVPLEFNVLWMEKEPGPTKRYEYRVVEMGMKMLLGAGMKPKYWFETDAIQYVRPKLESYYAGGFRIVLVIAGSIAVMEKSLDDVAEPEAPLGASPQKADHAPRYRSLRYPKPQKLEEQLKKAATNGYRMVDLDATPPPLEPAVILEKTAHAAEIPAYAAVEGKGLAATEKLMSDAGSRGFRLLPRSVRFGGQEWSIYQFPPNEKTGIRAVLAKPAGVTATYEYRLLAHERPDALFSQMRKLVEEGYRLAGLLSAQFLIMERAHDGGKEVTQ